MIRLVFRAASAAASLLLAGALWAQQATDAVAPEGETVLLRDLPGLSRATRDALAEKAAGRPVRARNWMVVAANPLAVDAGARVLRAGGTAADAFVAVQAVLGLVEPQSSGLGGGGFLVWFDAASGGLTTLDGRETAPLSATPRLFQDDAGEPLKFWDAVLGGASVGTPATPALMQAAHERWGNQPWAGLFTDAIGLAENGFPVSPRLAAMIAGDAERLGRTQAARSYFLPEGAPPMAGSRKTNPAYAATLRLMAQGGAAAFYRDLGPGIVAAVRAEGGGLSLTDLAIYRIRERLPVCVEYRAYRVCGMGPPSSGGLAIGQMLGMLSGFDLAALGPDNAESWRLIGDAQRLAFADRGRYVADSDFVPVPVQGLIDPAYLAARAGLLRGDDALPEVTPGAPEWDHTRLWADETPIEQPSTSHVSIVDGYGNALAMTASVENAFGARIMVQGFLLNNQLTDFSFRAHRDGIPVANRVEPGKRPRSSMSPTIVLKDGRPVLVIGSPGGSRIIGYVAQAIIAHLDWGMDAQAAVAMPHLVNRFGRYDIETGVDPELAAAVSALGYEVKSGAMNSGLHAIVLGDGLSGGADPRREGVALGE